MAYAIVQSSNNATGNSPMAVTFTSTPVQGNLMLASVTDDSTATAPTISDTNGTWTLLNSVAHGATGGLYLYGKIAVALQPITITLTQATDNAYMALYEMSGNPSSISGIVDVAASANSAAAATTTAGSQPSVTTTNAGDLLITQMGWPSVVTVPTPVTSGGATVTNLQSTVAGTIKLADAYAIETTTGTFNPSWTWTTGHSWSQLTTALFPASPSSNASTNFFNFI